MNEENKQQQQGGMTAEAKPNGEYNFEEALQKAVEKCQTSQIEALTTFFKVLTPIPRAAECAFAQIRPISPYMRSRQTVYSLI